MNTLDTHYDEHGNSIYVAFSGFEPKMLWFYSYRAARLWLSLIEARINGGLLYVPEANDPA